ncbi:MAG: N-acetyltransferase [Bacteroidetes bacterium]|nr:N-acetyltransferase [Bacteroidota bacterium]
MIHPLADVQSVRIGSDTKIWQFSVVLKDAVIGENCNINCHVFVENDVVIGNNVTIKAGVYIWDGIRIEDQVFVGPNVTFTNDKTPRSKQYPDLFQHTVIRHNASIGAGSIVLGGTEIGEYALIGAGSLVNRDVPARAMVLGNPARRVGWVNKNGTRMITDGDFFVDDEGNKWKVTDNTLIQL